MKIDFTGRHYEVDDQVKRYAEGKLRKLRKFLDEPVEAQKRAVGQSFDYPADTEMLDIPAFLLPLVNPDNNQHSPNENIRLGNYREGIRIMLAILTHNLR